MRHETRLLPLKTVGGLNARDHWKLRSRRVREERHVAMLFALRMPLPCTVTLTRHSPGTLDSDNLQGALKAIRDGVADKLGVNDADPRVTWLYAQKRCKAKEYGVVILMESTV